MLINNKRLEMTRLNYCLNQDNYSSRNSSSWGICLGHWQKVQTGTLDDRLVHALIAVTHSIPIVGQISSRAEKYIVNHFNGTTPKDLSQKNISQIDAKESVSLQLPTSVVNPAKEAAKEQLTKPVEAVTDPHLKDTRIMFKPVFTLRIFEQDKVEVFEKLLKKHPWFKAKEAVPYNGEYADYNVGYTDQEIDAIPQWKKFHFYYSENYITLNPRKLQTYSQDADEVKGTDFSDVTFQTPLAKMTESDVLSEMLNQSNGICIADTSHGMREPKQFLIDHLIELKQLGVTTLFLEFMHYDTQQLAIDHHPDPETLPNDFKYFFQHLDYEHSLCNEDKSLKPGYVDLVQATRTAGIRLVGLDTNETYNINPTDEDGNDNYHERGAKLNNQAVNIIRKEIKSNEKYAVFCGGAHVVNHKGVPGISQWMKIPNIFIEQKQYQGDCQPIMVNQPQHPTRDEVQGKVHALIHR